MCLLQIDRYHENQKTINPESFFDNLTEANDLSYYVDSTDRTTFYLTMNFEVPLHIPLKSNG